METPSDTTQWFYLKNGTKHGPIDAADLAALIQSGALPADIPVFNNTQTEWLPANTTGTFPLKAASALTTIGGWRIAAGGVMLLLAFGIGHFFVPSETPEAVEPKPAQKIAAKPESNQKDSGKLNFKIAGDTDKPVVKKTDPEKDSLIQKVDEYDEQLAQSKIDLLDAQNRLSELQKYNTKLQSQIRDLQKPKPDPKLTAELAESDEQRRQIAQRLNAANLHNQKLRTQIEALRKELANAGDAKKLAAQLAELSAELDAANVKISSLEQQLQATQSSKPPKRPKSQREKNQLQQPQIAVPTQPKSAQIIRTPAAPSRLQAIAQVTNIDTANGLILLNRGSDQGVKNGEKFRIISRTTGAFLGELTIRRTRPTLAVGTLNGAGSNRPKTGDLLYR